MRAGALSAAAVGGGLAARYLRGCHRVASSGLDALVISHLPVDHVGGLHAIRRRSFAFPIR